MSFHSTVQRKPEFTPHQTSHDDADGAREAFAFAVYASADPSVLSRVVELFVLRDMIPDDVAFRHYADEGLIEVRLQARGLSVHEARHLATRIEQFPSVAAVDLIARGTAR